MSDDRQKPETATTDTAASPLTVPDDSAGWLLAERAAWHLLEKKAENILVLDLRGRSDVCDFFVLASGTSKVQTKALAKYLHDALLTAGHRPQGQEGMAEGRWVLLDFFDVVVHIFVTEARDYFQLERLWGDAPRRELDVPWYTADDVHDRHPDLNFATVTGRDVTGSDSANEMDE